MVRSFPMLVSLQKAATFIRLNAGRKWSCNFPTTTKVERRSVSKLTWLLSGVKLWISCPLWLTVTHLLFSSFFSMTFHFERERITFAPWGIWTSNGSSFLPVEINVITGLSWISSSLRNPCLVESDVACKANRFEKERSVVLFLQRAITSTPVFSKNKWPVFCSAGYSNSIFLVPGNYKCILRPVRTISVMELRRLINDDGDCSDNDTYWITSILSCLCVKCACYLLYIYLASFFCFFQLFCIYKLVQANVYISLFLTLDQPFIILNKLVTPWWRE